MNEEIDDEILESELADDALEKKMRKMEEESARLLNHTNELLQELNKARAKKEEATLEENVKSDSFQVPDSRSKV